MINVICKHCNKEFGKYPYQLKNRKHHFCSVTCNHNYRKSKIPSKERKRLSDRKYYLANKEKLVAYAKEYAPKWRRENPVAIKAIQLRHRKKVRGDAIAAYGGKCACCGITGEIFLCIDHINNDGSEHRKKEGIKTAGYRMYIWLRKHNFPSGFQVLCYNCNMAKHQLGICPHQSKPSS